MQSYTEIPETQSLQTSRALILNNDKTALSCSSGTVFPTANLILGMLCFRTDKKILYQLTDLATSTWSVIVDFANPNAAASDLASLSGTINTALANKAPLASPALTGTPTAPTATAATNSTQIASTAFVQSAVSPKANLASPALSGTPTTPTAGAGTNTTQIASTAFVASGLAGKANSAHAHAQADVTGLVAALAAKANLASPALTGVPTAPTAAAGVNTTQIASTAFANSVVNGTRDIKSGGAATPEQSITTYAPAGGTAYTFKFATNSGFKLKDGTPLLGIKSVTGVAVNCNCNCDGNCG